MNNMNPEALAKDILQQHRRNILKYIEQPKNEPDLLRKHCIYATISYARNRYNELQTGNKAFDILFGDTNSEKYDSSYNDIAKLVCNDKVIDTLVELVKS